MATKGATSAVKNEGRLCVSTATTSWAETREPLFLKRFAKKYVSIKPKIAGIIPAIITDVKGRWNVSAAAIALGLGDIKFPAFPPPIIAKRMAGFDKSVRRASAKAIGETVITATSINTPTAVKINVANANANNALVSPNLFVMVSAMVLAAPDSISTPANTPAARIRMTAVVIP